MLKNQNAWGGKLNRNKKVEAETKNYAIKSILRENENHKENLKKK
jgi:hypothetical protein